MKPRLTFNLGHFHTYNGLFSFFHRYHEVVTILNVLCLLGLVVPWWFTRWMGIFAGTALFIVDLLVARAIAKYQQEQPPGETL